MATIQEAPKTTEVPIARQSDVDEKEQVDHLEAAPRSSDPKTAALQDGIEALHRLSQEEYDALHKRLVRKVSGHQKLTWDGGDTYIQIDTRLLPVLFVLLVLNYLDRNALA